MKLKKLRLQSVLYNTDIESLRSAYKCAAHACRVAIKKGLISEAEIVYGDCSPEQIITQDVLNSWVSAEDDHGTLPIKYNYFGRNLGSAAGHNALMMEAFPEDSDNCWLVIMNPDVKMYGETIVRLIGTFSSAAVGLVEARQLPIEHPKYYEEDTGDTSWASTATALTTKNIFLEVGGFDANTFFLYGDDVDFSWMVREKGYKVLFQPSATVFHDKRLNDDGSWPATDAEHYYSAEASLYLTYKWSRQDLTQKFLRRFKRSGNVFKIKAANSFEEKMKNGELPAQRDKGHVVATFTRHGYNENRF